MLVLDGVYVERPDGTLRFRRVAAPTSAELNALTASLAHRIGRFLERRGLIERDAENAWLTGDDDIEAAALEQLRAASITYRIALGPRRGKKAFTLQTLPPVTEEVPEDGAPGLAGGFSLGALRGDSPELGAPSHPCASPCWPTWRAPCRSVACSMPRYTPTTVPHAQGHKPFIVPIPSDPKRPVHSFGNADYRG